MRAGGTPARGDERPVAELLLDPDSQVGERGAVAAGSLLDAFRSPQLLHLRGIVGGRSRRHQLVGGVEVPAVEELLDHPPGDLKVALVHSLLLSPQRRDEATPAYGSGRLAAGGRDAPGIGV